MGSVGTRLERHQCVVTFDGRDEPGDVAHLWDEAEQVAQ